MVSLSNHMSGQISSAVTPLISFDKLRMSGVIRYSQNVFGISERSATRL